MIQANSKEEKNERMGQKKRTAENVYK